MAAALIKPKARQQGSDLIGPRQQSSDPLGLERRRYLEGKYGLAPEELDSLLEELWAFTDERPEDFVRRRHGELQRAGLRNEAIYRRVAHEAEAGRFKAPDLSIRQVRRIVYG